MVNMPAEMQTLATFHAELLHFLDNDYFYENTFSHAWHTAQQTFTDDTKKVCMFFLHRHSRPY